jgi:uncharacterized membrane protein
MKGKKTRLLVKAALVGAIYAALTLIPPFSAISFGPIQFRLSEVLMFTSLFSPAYAGGLFVGCLLANIFGTGNLFDIVFGSLATLLAGLTLYGFRNVFLKHKWLAPLPVSVFNGLIVGGYLPFIFMDVAMEQLFAGGFSNLFFTAFAATPVLGTMLSVFIGEAVVCYILGVPFIYFLCRQRKMLE